MDSSGRITAARWTAFDGLVRAMRAPPGQTDCSALLDTATAALELCVEELAVRGSSAVERMVALDELSQSHLRSLVVDFLAGDERIGSEHQGWRTGGRFLYTLQHAYLVGLGGRDQRPLQRGVRLELMVRRLRTAALMLKWRSLAYFGPEPEFWDDVIGIGRLAWAEGISSRQIRLRRDRAAQTSIDRELARIVALGCAGLDQLKPDAIDVADRVLKYAAPALRLSRSGGVGARFMLPLAPSGAPRRAAEHGDAGADGIYLWPGEAAAALEELGSVVAKGFVPAVLASGPEAREQVLAAVHHLVRLWSGPRRMRRHRRHPMGGGVRALLGFQQLQSSFATQAKTDHLVDGWGMLDASRNGIGIRVPAKDCDRMVVGDMLGVQAHDGETWHVGIVRRIIRSEDGEGIVGIETIASAVSAASIDNGRALAEVLLCDPVRRGGALRVAHQGVSGDSAGGLVFLTQDGRICKLKRLGTLVRGRGYELTNYRVL